MGSAGGSSTFIGSVVSWSIGLGSDMVFSFFFFLGITVAVPHVSVSLCSRRQRRADHSPVVPST